MKNLKKLLLPALFCSAAVSALITPATAMACGPYYEPSYNDGIADPYKLFLRKRKAIQRFVELYPEMFPPAFKVEKGLPTKEAAVKDFQDAVKRYLPKLPAEEQQKMIIAFTEFMKKWNRSRSLQGYPELPPELDEFRLYFEGCMEMKPDGGYKAPEAWLKLLQLPPEKRHFRTVWVHYMLGNYCKADLHTHYRNCREAARAGFADSAGLACASYRAEVKYGRDPVKVVRIAAEAVRQVPQPPQKKYTPYDTEYYLPKTEDFLPWRYLEKMPESQYAALVTDPVCREVLAILDGHTERFRQKVIGLPLKNADILAYHCYNQGKIGEAEKFLGQQEKPTLVSVFLEAKIARHKGNYPRVIKKMREWLKMVKEAGLTEENAVIARGDYGYDGIDIEVSWEMDAYGHLGNALVLKRDFMEAAECFYKAGQSDDLAEILEIFLSLDEAVAFAEKIKADIQENDEHDVNRKVWFILDIVSRRALREGREDIARKYMSMYYWGQQNLYYLDQMNSFIALSMSDDETLSRDDRAIALLNAAKIMRFRGMELFGTETGPDWYPGNSVAGRSLHTVTTDLLRLFNAPRDYRTVPNHIDFRFHYRRDAALMALKAGELAEDKDLKAFIHCYGGECLRNDLPGSADIFYKRMVIQSRGNILSESGDVIRWFPQTMNTMLMNELKRIEPVESLDEVKELMQRLAGTNLGKLIAPEETPEKTPETKEE